MDKTIMDKKHADTQMYKMWWLKQRWQEFNAGVLLYHALFHAPCHDLVRGHGPPLQDKRQTMLTCIDAIKEHKLKQELSIFEKTSQFPRGECLTAPQRFLRERFARYLTKSKEKRLLLP